MDWTVQEDRGVLAALNLSALSFLIFPMLGVIVPLIIWVSRKDKATNINKTAKSVLNFQITWLMAGVMGCIALIITWIFIFRGIGNGVGVSARPGDVSLPSMAGVEILMLLLLFWGVYNFVFTLVNAVRASKGRDVEYFPSIRFIK